jgi:hypothetical protein
MTLIEIGPQLAGLLQFVAGCTVVLAFIGFYWSLAR